MPLLGKSWQKHVKSHTIDHCFMQGLAEDWIGLVKDFKGPVNHWKEPIKAPNEPAKKLIFDLFPK